MRDYRDTDTSDERRADERAAEEGTGEERRADEPAADERTAEELRADEQGADERAADERAPDRWAAEPAADEQLTVPEDRDAAAAADGRSASPETAAATSGAASASDRPSNSEQSFELFGGQDLEGYRQRWEVLQASFVDDPRAATEQADTMVRELVEQLTRRHQELHDEVGTRSDGGDTEAMRIALRRYRSFYRTIVGG